MVNTGVRAAAYAQQDGYSYRFDWGLDGLRSLAPVADVVVVVDILRFTSAVSAALESGSVVLPYPWGQDDSHTDAARAYSAQQGAVLAGRREHGAPSLSPTDLLTMAAGTRLVLPSPNGAALCFAARELGAKRILAGSLRNATATAHFGRAAAGVDGVVAVVAAGERWGGAGDSVRPAFEDLVGAGAILAALDPSGAVAHPRCSPEAAAARAAFQFAQSRLFEHLCGCASGRELVAIGCEDDIATSAAYDVTAVVAELVDDEFVRAGLRVSR